MIPEEMVQQFEPMVYRLARKYYCPKLDLEDRVQEGFLGLCEAWGSYDSSLGVQFETHAYNRIRFAIIKATQRETAEQHSMGFGILKNQGMARAGPAQISLEEAFEGYDLPDAHSSEDTDAILTREFCREALGTLSEYARGIVEEFFGLCGEPLISYEIGRRRGCSNTWVNRIRHKALGQMREWAMLGEKSCL